MRTWALLLAWVSSAAEVYDAYCRFCETNGCRPTNAANFGRQVRRTFPTVGRLRRRDGHRQVWTYTGLAVQEGSDVATERRCRAPGNLRLFS